ncbi:MAG: hypothetical protein BWY75_02400 [bacterium ADurb.Bin425]|nr:MAG: hypothetical protein BWY75_02400 [bacterium ADurb.Bin425]
MAWLQTKFFFELLLLHIVFWQLQNSMGTVQRAGAHAQLPARQNNIQREVRRAEKRKEEKNLTNLDRDPFACCEMLSFSLNARIACLESVCCHGSKFRPKTMAGKGFQTLIYRLTFRHTLIYTQAQVYVAKKSPNPSPVKYKYSSQARIRELEPGEIQILQPSPNSSHDEESVQEVLHVGERHDVAM